MYEITLTINRDCELGADNAPFDDPAVIGIFDPNGRPLFDLGTNGELLVNFEEEVTLQNQIQQVCFTSSNNICVHSTEYKGIVELPGGVDGYVLAYQRCCRNETLLNVVEPLETGLTLSIELTREALDVCNSSPAFRLAPDIFICAGDVLEFDGSAVDSDGDVLVYSACIPSNGATIDDPRPQPPAAPPYAPIEYVDGFSENNPLGTLEADFNSETGLYTVTPQALGQYLVGLCVEEYRDGVLLSRVTREFQYNVVRCVDQIVSDFDVAQDGCSLSNVQFTNLTPSATNFMWFFDYPSTDPAFTSTDPNPVFNYPTAGNYEVRLVTSREDGSCESISDRNVTISDGQSTEIQSNVLFCDGNTYTLRLSDPVSDRTDRNWIITIDGQQTTANSQFVDIVVERDARVMAELTATTATGCVETSTINFNVNLIDFNVDLVTCGANGSNTATIVLSPNQPNSTTDNPILSYEWFVTNGEDEIRSTDELFQIDVDFTNTFWVGLTVVFENGCQAEVERIILPFGMIEFTGEVQTDAGSSVTFFNFDDVISNYFDNPTSTPINDPIIQKEWVITSPSQGEVRGFGDEIVYTTTLNETILVSYFYTTESGCVFEVRTTFTFMNGDACASLGPDDDICAILAADPSNPLGVADCDGGGADNATECNNGTVPNNPDDDCIAILAGDIDICALLVSNPDSPLADLDCDGDGFTNAEECNSGSDPSDGCDLPDGETIDICAILAEDPDSPLGMFDCDGGGADNATECENGTDPTDPSDDCVAILSGMVDICAILIADPNSPLADLDCDGDGFTNAEECNSGSDPTDGCDLPDGETIDICAILAEDPDSPLGMFDCDGGGADNATECENGTDPTDPSDDCQGIIDNMIDICAILAADPDNTIAGADCDNDGVSNGVECNNGTDPLNPLDACIAIAAEGLDICEILRLNPNSELAGLDCDGDGFTNFDECNRGSDPSDGCDIPAGESPIDICAILAADPNSPLGAFDCDNGGVDNATECQNGTNPNDPGDDCQAAVAGMLDICAILAADPNSPLANLDCDGDGFSNLDECNRGSDPIDGCSIPAGETIDICALLALNPDSPIGQFDCDGGGADNATECENGTDPNNPDDDCQAILDGNVDICAILAADPNSPLATLDCDGDGVDNITECNNGTDPSNPSFGCDQFLNGSANLCDFLANNPDSELATEDCDGDGFSNIDECNRGSDPADGCDFPDGESIDICAILAADPNSPLGMFDCDNGGISNADECLAGTNPNDPSDDCQAAVDGMVDICAIIAADPNSPLINLDCDGDTFSNLDECNRGSDPTDGCSIPAGESIDICAILAADPNSPLGQFDCDGGGIDNATECENGTDPNNPDDDCQAALNGNVDICAILAADPNSPLATQDCDNGGIDNATECNAGTNPLDPADDCEAALTGMVDICAILAADPDSPLGASDCDGDTFSNTDECNRGSDPSDGCDIPEGESIDICAILAADPDSPIGMFDCDNGGIDNLTECQNGTDPNNPDDDCQAAVNGMVDLCAILAADPDNPLADQDCDNGGIDNTTECNLGTDPLDPSDDCEAALDGMIDICALIAADPDNPIAQSDCDGDTFTNQDECDRGSDPSDGCDIPDGEMIDICAILAADPDSPLGMFDCDGGGIDNATECENGGDPTDPTDECLSAFDPSVDICAILAADPNSPLGALDCDGDGFTNLEECNRGSDPADGCDIPDGEMIDICAILEADPDSPIGMFDCDNGGVDNATECEAGTDPTDPTDECDAIGEGVDICQLLMDNPGSTLGGLDCDGDGVDNATECENGTDPSDPNDNCPIGVTVEIGDGLGIPEALCAGEDTPISVTVDSDDDLVFEWAPDECIVSGGDTPNPVINATTSKELMLRVLNNTIGCEMTIIVPINVSDPSITIVADPAGEINQGEDVTLTAQTDAENPTFMWNTGETNGSFDMTLDETTDFSVTVTDAFGCTATDVLTVTVNPASCDGSGIFLPNAFTPNGDGNNDVLFVRSNAIATLEFSVFDRWGREVFRTETIDEGWNGRWQNDGDELPPDAYGYWIMATCRNGQEYQAQGNVTILR